MLIKKKTILDHEGNKYLRPIRAALGDDIILVDVYAILEAYNVTCPGRQHAIKKLLCAGTRGKGTELADLVGADAALQRAIELQKAREITNASNQNQSQNQDTSDPQTPS